jgi:KDO2-lipid IV(A) lauroyltransferase
MKRNGRGKYAVSMTDICDDASKTEEGYITRSMASLMEADIMEQPENWLWSHKRWKHQKTDHIQLDTKRQA